MAYDYPHRHTKATGNDLKTRGSNAIGADKLHDKNMHAQVDGLWATDAGSMHARQIPELLLRPHLDHLARVALAVRLEAEVPAHIPAQAEASKISSATVFMPAKTPYFIVFSLATTAATACSRATSIAQRIVS